MWLFKNLRSARNYAGYYNCMIVLVGGSWLLLLPLKGALYASTVPQLTFCFSIRLRHGATTVTQDHYYSINATISYQV